MLRLLEYEIKRHTIQKIEHRNHMKNLGNHFIENTLDSANLCGEIGLK